MKIYLIGSLRNPKIPGIGNELRALGFAVFDDWYGAGERADDCWQNYEKERGRSYGQALHGHAVENVANFDDKHLLDSDIVILVMPAGKSGHLELGLSIGRGKIGFILFEEEPERWDAMYHLAIKYGGGVYFDLDALKFRLKGIIAAAPPKAKGAILGEEIRLMDITPAEDAAGWEAARVASDAAFAKERAASKSGLGTMMAGGNPADGREERDFYPTPPECTRALLEVEKFSGGIWENASGDDAIVKVLRAAGYKVVATDLEPQPGSAGVKADFFAIKPRKIANILTNPPFDLSEKWIEHCMAFTPDKLVLMLKATYWHAVTRQPLFDKFRPARVYPLTWRPDFMGKGRPTMEVAWIVWDRTHDGSYPRYIPLLKAPVDRLKPRASRKQAAISQITKEQSVLT